MIKLTDTYLIAEEANGFSLVKRSIAVDKDGNVKRSDTGDFKYKEDKKYYGTVYQALTGFLMTCVDNSGSLDDVETKVKACMKIIDRAEAEIKAKFRTEVKVQ